LLVLLVSGAVGVSGQAAPQQQPKEVVVGISLDSNYARIADFLPSLRDSLVKTLPKRRKQVRTIAIDAPPQNAAAAARTQACDYLLQLSVQEIRGVGVGFSTFKPSPDISPEEERERRELDWVRVDYRLRSLKNDDLDIADIDHVRYADIPSGWNPTAFETTVFRTVTRVAVSTLNKLPKR
jgi:hypothetical protein